MKRANEQIPHAMLSDIELKFCKGCGIYRSLDKFYMNSNPGNYCMDCKREQMRKYNALYTELRRKERVEKEKMEEERRQRVKEYKRRYYAKKKAAAGKPVREWKRKPEPKVEPHEPIAHGQDKCKTCKSYSPCNKAEGWCMRRRKSVLAKNLCDFHETKGVGRYEFTVHPISCVNKTPYD